MSITWLVKVLIVIFISQDLYAAKRSRPKRKPKTKIEFDFRFDGLLGGAFQDPLENSVYNPGNQIYQFSEKYGFTELRPDAEFTIGEFFRMVARPRFRYLAQEKPVVTGSEAKTGLFDAYLNEGFFEFNVAAFLQISVGRQNYQWGPGEALNPTSFLFPDLTFRIEPFYEVRGRTMARANISIGAAWSWVLLAELNPLPDESFDSQVFDDRNGERAGTKLEYVWDSGAKNIGLVAGKKKDQNLGGLYLMWTFNDAFQMYGDMLVTQGSSSLYVTGDPVVPLARAGASTETENQGVAGARFTFSSGAEWRWEYLFNQGGYSTREQAALKALFAVNPLAVPFWTANQTHPLLGQDYLYTSIRQNWTSEWLGLFRQPALALRILYSFGDESIFGSGSFEGGLSDYGTIYFYGGLSGGEKDSELRRGVDSVFGLAYRHSFL